MSKEILGSIELNTQATSETVQTGGIRGSSKIMLHTRNAILLYTGKKLDKGHSYGLNNVTFHLNTMFTGSKKNCPYSDYYLLHIEETLLLLNASINEMTEIFKEKINTELPSGFSTEIGSVETPFITNIDGQNPFLFKLSFFLISYDDFVRKANTLAHIGLITPSYKKEIIEQQTKPFRSLMHFIRTYNPSGCTRDDFAANNQRVIKAKEIYPNIELPEDILSGERRSEYAPTIIKDEDQIPLTSADEPNQPDGTEAEIDAEIAEVK
ncbi:PFL_4669 family integrating conjugative element protein [Photobacterium sp. GB-72]|uniref:PFL_4669 family integrating conjugative element protein n=1 Tax=Photobacterium sp. GB-72 TaxID=2022105 RepID=UPI000D167F41|nr:TIGR03761 family integrating conjugative element protein [Photobacterium sp. GB-72]PSV27632.1 TIGR03761 family integrating conjugative element protein [Photobacterium sp. GB-72]